MAHALRTPQVDLAAILAAQNPHIDLRLDAYDASNRNFSKAVASYAARVVAEITQRRNAHAAELKKLADRTQVIEAETNRCKMKEIELVATLEKEKEELKSAESSVAALRRQLSSIREASAALDVEIEQYRAVTSNLRKERNSEHATLNWYASTTSPELRACESRLRCIVEGIAKDQLLIRFSHVDPTDHTREFSFVLDVSARSYRVLTSTPPLPTLPILVDQLNDSRNVYGFIKSVRQAYVELLK